VPTRKAPWLRPILRVAADPASRGRSRGSRSILRVFVAFVIGTIELIGVTASKGGFDNVQPWEYISNIDLGKIGYPIVAVFLVAWPGSVAVWELGHYEENYGRRVKTEPTATTD